MSLQAVEKRDLLHCASSFVITAYCRYASFLRIRAPCISLFLNSLPQMLFINGLLYGDAVFNGPSMRDRFAGLLSLPRQSCGLSFHPNLKYA